MQLKMSLWLRMIFSFYSYFVKIQFNVLDDRGLFVMLVKFLNCLSSLLSSPLLSSPLLSSPLLSGSPISELGASYPGARPTETQRGGEQRDTEDHCQVSI